MKYFDFAELFQHETVDEAYNHWMAQQYRAAIDAKIPLPQELCDWWMNMAAHFSKKYRPIYLIGINARDDQRRGSRWYCSEGVRDFQKKYGLSRKESNYAAGKYYNTYADDYQADTQGRYWRTRQWRLKRETEAETSGSTKTPESPRIEGGAMLKAGDALIVALPSRAMVEVLPRQEPITSVSVFWKVWE